MAGSSFCEACAEIDFNAIFTPSESRHDDKVVITPRLFHSFQPRTSCPFCRLVAKTILAQFPSTAPRTLCHMRQELACEVFEPTPGNSLYYAGASKAYSQLRISIHPEGFSDKLGRLGLSERRARYREEFVVHSMCTADELRAEDMLRAREIKKQVDVELLKRWIGWCEERHIDIRPTQTPIINVKLYAVDVLKRMLVELPRDSKYAALSYIWGPKSCQQLRWTSETSGRLFSPGGLDYEHTDMPATIRDGIIMCRNLDLQYLWVDALCIQQDDEESTSATIAEMDAVYQNAFVTIVCAAGTDSWAGLPGIQPNSRSFTQYSEYIPELGLSLVNACMQFEDTVHNSAWHQRGWTFQEYLLSHRLLIFSEEQAYFVCDHVIWMESLITEAIPHAPVDFVMDWRLEFKNTGRDLETSLQYAAEGLCKRQLTYRGDLLNAFAGISSWLTRTQHVNFWHGLPMELFDAALLFQGSYTCARREGFSSWSWAGWHGREMTRFPDYFVTFESTIPEVKWLRWIRHDESGLGHYLMLDNSKAWTFSTEELEEEIPHTAYVPDRVEARNDVKRAGDNHWTLTMKFNSLRNNPFVRVPPEVTLERLARVRSMWKVPLSKQPSTQNPPSFLTNAELGRLLVFQTSCVFLEVKLDKETTNHESHTEYIHHARVPQNLSKSLNNQLNNFFNIGGGWEFSLRLLWPEVKPKILEFVVTARTQFYDHPNESALETMVVVTDERGISLRVERGPRLPDGIWAAMKPSWRTVFML